MQNGQLLESRKDSQENPVIQQAEITERYPVRNHDVRIWIVIPVHNRKEFTHDCLVSLQNQTVKNHHIIVVDDGSTDGTPEMLRREFPEVTVLEGNGNLYWTKAINRGIKHALMLGAELILTMNNDTVASGDMLEKMLYWSRKAPHDLLGALDMDLKTKKAYYGGELFNWTWSKSVYLLDELGEDQRHGLYEVSLYPGRGLLIPRIVFDTIGLFDAKGLPHYLADYDFTQTARRNGFKVYCNYDARVFTYPDASGDHEIRKSKTLKNYFNHLFGIKGGGNLWNFTVYSVRNCPRMVLPVALLTGYFRRMTGYWFR